MKKTLIDSGPIIALFDKGDKYHKKCLEFIKDYDGEFITSWSVIIEVSHMLDFNLQVQIDFLKWVEVGGIKIYDISQNDIVKIRVMMEKFQISMSLVIFHFAIFYIALHDVL